MNERKKNLSEAKEALNEARRNNKISIVIWVVYIVVMVALAIVEGATGRWGSMLNTGCLIFLAVYIILQHHYRSNDFDMLEDSLDLIEHMFTSHQEYVEHVEAIFEEARAAAEEEEKNEHKEE